MSCPFALWQGVVRPVGLGIISLYHSVRPRKRGGRKMLCHLVVSYVIMYIFLRRFLLICIVDLWCAGLFDVIKYEDQEDLLQ